MSLQTGTELISLALLFNKLTGLYGLLAILTGYGLSALQLSMYITNVLALGLLAWCIPHIRKQTPLQNLVLAWLYLVDTAISAAFTSLFAANWFLTATPPGDEEGGTPGTSDWMAPHETAISLVLVIAFTLVRLYFAAVVMSHTSVVLQRHVERPAGVEDNARGNPFAPGMPHGEGWKGKAGRALAYVGQEYWLGPQADEDWEAGMKPKFRGAEPPSGSSEAP